MSDPVTSPEVSHEDPDEEQIDEELVEQERVYVEDDEAEDIIEDEEVEGEGDVEEEEKPEGQEGLDLEMGDEDGMGYQDEADGENEAELKGPDDEELYDRDGGDGVVDDSKEGALQEEEATHAEEKEEPIIKHEEKKEDPLSLPPHGSEVFVGGISKDTVEDDLREMCAPCGDVIEVRVMRDKGESKGFAFVTFSNKESAEKAIATLNEHEFKGRKLRFCPSQSKNKLFVGNIPKAWDKDELHKALSERGAGIINIELLKDAQNPERNRGFAFVEYHNHLCAENARRSLSMPGFKLGSNPPTINWAADTRSATDNAAMSQVKVVYVRNLPENITQEQLQKLFEHHGEIEKVMLPQPKAGQPKRDFGFIHFVDRASALKAIEKTERYEIEGRELEASLAKPPTEKRPVGLLNAPFRAGLLPPFLPQRAGFGYPDADIFGGAYGAGRGYGQPVIYGRGPAPAGMAMVPMLLPDGRMGYVLQQPGGQGMAAHRDGRGGGRGSASQRQNNVGGGSSRRYRPY